MPIFRQLAKLFYAQAVEERNHAMMIVRYFLDRDMGVELSGVRCAHSQFDSAREPIQLALQQEKTVTEQMIQLAGTAREEGDYLGEQFMQWFLKEQVEEVARMTHPADRRRAGGHESVRPREFRRPGDEQHRRQHRRPRGRGRQHLIDIAIATSSARPQGEPSSFVQRSVTCRERRPSRERRSSEVSGASEASASARRAPNSVAGATHSLG